MAGYVPLTECPQGQLGNFLWEGAPPLAAGVGVGDSSQLSPSLGTALSQPGMCLSQGQPIANDWVTQWWDKVWPSGLNLGHPRPQRVASCFRAPQVSATSQLHAPSPQGGSPASLPHVVSVLESAFRGPPHPISLPPICRAYMGWLEMKLPFWRAEYPGRAEW